MAKKAKYAIDTSGLLQERKCTALRSADDIARDYIKRSPKLKRLVRTLSTPEPQPVEEDMPIKPGQPFVRDYRWHQKCEELFDNNNLPPDVYAQMAEFYPTPPKVISHPEINQVEVYDQIFYRTLREANVRGKVLKAKYPQDDNWRFTWNMGVNIDSPPPAGEDLRIIKKIDNTGKQILLIDIVPGYENPSGVVPGQKVILRGSGFVADKANVVMKFAEWLDPDSGMLVAESNMRQISVKIRDVLNIVDVHGNTVPIGMYDTADSYKGDVIVFEWPMEAARQGLYSLRLEFENPLDETGRPYVSRITDQSETSCRLDAVRAEKLSTKELWFAVLPTANNHPIDPVATKVTCVDESDPERYLFVNLFDDISYQVGMLVETMNINISSSSNPVGIPIPVLTNTRNPEVHQFWNSGEEFSYNIRLLPDDRSVYPIGGFDTFAAILSVNQLFNPTARFILKIALIVALIAAFLILCAIAVIVAIAAGIAVFAAIEIIAAIFGLGGGAAVVLPEAVKAGVAVAGLLMVFFGTVLTVFVGPVFLAAGNSISAWVDSLPGSRKIFTAFAPFQGNEIAWRTSKYRVHQLLWPEPRPLQLDDSIEVETSSFDENSIQETYIGGDSRSGRYRVQLDISLQ